MHPGLAVAGFGIGCAVAALGWWRQRVAPDTGQGGLASLLVLAVVVVLLVARQVPPLAVAPLLVVPWIAWLGGGFTPTVRVRAAHVVVAGLVATVLLAAVLPDTEGPVVLGAALVPMVVAALAAPVTWRGADALMGTSALVTGVVVVAVDASAGRTGSLAVALVAAAVCAGLSVVAVNLLVGDRLSAADVAPITSERARPSR